MTRDTWHVWSNLKDAERRQDDDGVSPRRLVSYRGPVGVGFDESKGRVERVREALDQSKYDAMNRVAGHLKGIDATAILGTLMNAAIDMATLLGATVIVGGVLGGIVGSLGGGVGAVPGAAVGAAAGGQIGTWILGFLGLKSLAEDLGEAIPKAYDCYRDGFREAWGPPPRWNRHEPPPSDWHLVARASRSFADGHVIVLTALLSAMAAYLTRGKGDRGLLLEEIRQSPRLGPRVADWVAANEEKLRHHPALKARERPMASALVPEKPPRQAETPSRAWGRRAEEAQKAEKPTEQKNGPCDHLKRGAGGGKYRGGAHGKMGKPTNDGKDSHHMPPDDVSPLPTKDGTAIQMDPPDHRETSSNGNNGRAGAAYREMIKQLLEKGEWRKAMAIEIKDVRKIARDSGDPKKYNGAIQEMMAYFNCMQKHGLLK